MFCMGRGQEALHSSPPPSYMSFSLFIFGTRSFRSLFTSWLLRCCLDPGFASCFLEKQQINHTELATGGRGSRQVTAMLGMDTGSQAWQGQQNPPLDSPCPSAPATHPTGSCSLGSVAARGRAVPAQRWRWGQAAGAARTRSRRCGRGAPRHREALRLVQQHVPVSPRRLSQHAAPCPQPANPTYCSPVRTAHLFHSLSLQAPVQKRLH